VLNAGGAELLERLRADLAGRYDVEREVGRGGMATVFLAQDLRLHRRVAIKLLRPDLAALIGTRFLREIEILANLSHPHILPLHESGEAANTLYYVMPYVEGETLRERLDREPQLPIPYALHIVRDVTDALAFAHAHGIIHRDIKPENILLTADDAILADFGIARAISAAGGSQLTGEGLAIGTPLYMSPEQATGGVTLDARTDVYSLACVLYHMLAGSPPFVAPTPRGVLARQMTDSVPLLRVVRPKVSPALEDVIIRALEKVPADRYPTATAFLEALEGAAGAAGAAGAGAHGRRARRLRPAVLAFAAGILLTGVAALAARRLGIERTPTPDPERIVVFPASFGAEDGGTALLGEDVATAMVAAFNSTRFLKAVDGWRFLGDAERVRAGGVSARAAASVARAQRAAFFVVGRLVRGDSLHLVADVVDVRGDSAVQRTVALPRGADGWTIGMAGARALLAGLVGSDPSMDLAALGSSTPAAATAFLRGQRAYRRGRFDEAYVHFRAAVAEDSSFALAAIMGAQTAGWGRRRHDAEGLARAALRRVDALPPRYTAFVRGLSASWQDQADTAVVYLEKALAEDPAWPEAWVELGEVYAHWQPRRVPAESLLRAAFTTAYRLDPSFVPALYHLIVVAARDGDVAGGERLLRVYRASRADTTELAGLALALRCVARSPEAIDWRDEVARHPVQVDDIAAGLAAGSLPQAACARAAWSAILDYDTATDARARERRGSAMEGLLHTLLAARRLDEARALLQREAWVSRQQRWQLVVLSALAGAPLQPDVAEAAESLRAVARAGGPDALGAWWYVGVWATRLGDAATATAALDAVRRAPRRTRADSLLGRTLTAWATLARGDTTVALRSFGALAGGTNRTPWEAQGAERMQEAELLAARGRYSDAIRVATEIDAPSSVRNVMYLPTSLAVRARAARALGDERAAARFEQRLAALTGDATVRAPR
jgi:tetratricopeptide (TPR) repeat protein